MISNVSYELIIALPKGGQYFGKVIANFDVKVLAKNGTNDQLFIDYFGSDIKNLVINGKPIDALQ